MEQFEEEGVLDLSEIKSPDTLAGLVKRLFKEEKVPPILPLKAQSYLATAFTEDSTPDDERQAVREALSSVQSKNARETLVALLVLMAKVGATAVDLGAAVSCRLLSSSL